MINKKEYELLCRIYDKVLLHDSVSKYIVANTSLHILREHPDFLKKYQILFTSSRLKSKFDTVFWLGRYTLISFIRIFSSLFNTKAWYCVGGLRKSDVLFVSHLINEEHLSNKDDFYFHDIPEKLASIGLSSSVALINHVKHKNSPDTGFKILLSPTLSFISELTIFFKQWSSIGLLKQLFRRNEVPPNLSRKALIGELSSDTANTLRIAKQIGMLLKKTESKFLVITYEGHAWERLVFYEARKVNPNIKCIGYQHAVIFEHQHAIRRLLRSEYNPDVILTAGNVAKKQFDNLKYSSSIVVKCLGSHKSRAVVPSKNVKVRKCLVVPEGIISESILLFEFSLQCAKEILDYQFVWRLHPLLSFEKLKKHSKVFNELPENIELSKISLNSDIERCDAVLYRGSTAVVEAVNAGLMPIYYANNEELSIDPIYDQKLGKYVVRNVKEFINSIKYPIDSNEQKKLSEYAQNFYTPLDYKLLSDVLCS